MEKFITICCMILMLVTMIFGVKALRDLNDGRVKTVVHQLQKVPVPVFVNKCPKQRHVRGI